MDLSKSNTGDTIDKLVMIEEEDKRERVRQPYFSGHMISMQGGYSFNLLDGETDRGCGPDIVECEQMGSEGQSNRRRGKVS